MNQKYKFAIVFLAVGLLLGSFVTYSFSQGSSTFTLTSGIYPGAPDFTVWVESGTYYAKNQYGSLAYSGTNATAVINSAIANGGRTLLTSGTYLIPNSLNVTVNGVTIEGDQKGNVFLDWTGAVGGSIITTSHTPYIYDLTIKNLELRTGDESNAIYLFATLRYVLRDLVITGESLSNTYAAIVLDATYGNNAWGIIDNIFCDYQKYCINAFGTDSSHVVTDINIGSVFSDHITGYGLRFAQWTDTIDVDFAYFVSGAENVTGVIFNDGVDPDIDNGVYNIHISRLIFDNWVYSGTYTLKLNNVKQIIVDSAWKGNSTDTLASISAYAVGFRIVQQGQGATNIITIYYRNVTETEV